MLLVIVLRKKEAKIANSVQSINKWINELYLKGQCPDCAHARASSAFSSKDNRTVILTRSRQDFLPDRTADGDLLFTFSSNILDFRRSFSSYLKFGSRYKDSSRFCRYRAASRPENLVPFALKTAFLMWNSCQRSIVPSPVIFEWFARVLVSNVWRIYIKM